MINEYKAKLYCKDDISKIENYDKAMSDTTQTWHCHHRLELTLDGEFAHSPDDLKRLDMYYNRPYFELIFVTKSEHSRMHFTTVEKVAWNKGLATPEEVKLKNSLSHIGRTPWNKGKKCNSRSEEDKKRISAKLKGRCKHNLGKHWKLVDGKRVWYE